MVMPGTLIIMTMPSWVSGEESKPAPMPLLLVQSFVNTWDGDHNSDLLLDPATAREWLTEAGLWSAERAPDPAELHRARAVREGIRAVLAANSGGPAPSPTILSPCRPSPAPSGRRSGLIRTDASPSGSTPPTTPARACSPCCW